MATKFYKCPHCGNVIVKMVDGGPVPVCCGEPMNELDPVAPAVAEFCTCKSPVVAVYEYCNLHGLWVKEM